MVSSKSTAKKAKQPPVKRKSTGAKTNASDRILQAIVSRNAFGDAQPNREMIMGMVAVTNKNSFGNMIRDMKKKKNWVDYDTTSIWLTDEGKDYVGPDAMAVPANNDAMHDKIRDEMIEGRRSREIFDLMLDGGWHTRAELAAALKVANTNGFANNIYKLSKLTEKKSGKIRLSDMVFPCGRPSA